jgi:chromodomain-helicase-DNA-binding protein 1
MRREKSGSDDGDDYALKAHKKKNFAPSATRDTPDAGFADSDSAWRRGAAKKVVTYDEAQADYGLESEDEEMYYQEGEIPAGESKRSDIVLTSSRRCR